ncbi:hypothetical protein NXC14_PA00157 (plasmid) [Rhizobium sp. NXC14]|nr:hypothetical protein NXC14_PA00157 [Rhizobium sp. NXC14]
MRANRMIATTVSGENSAEVSRLAVKPARPNTGLNVVTLEPDRAPASERYIASGEHDLLVSSYTNHLCGSINRCAACCFIRVRADPFAWKLRLANRSARLSGETIHQRNME